MGNLVLTRRPHERVRLLVPVPGNEPVEVWVMLVEVRRGLARLAFDAPPEVQIKREELLKENLK
jgi:sRNA-binding carbon storage regulator CsrA